MVTTKRPFTLSDLYDLPNDNQLYEVIEGELVVFAAPNDPHMVAVLTLISMLLTAQSAGYGRVGMAPRAVALDFPVHGMESRNMPQPDVFFVRKERQHILARRAVEGPPDLVVEVLSPSTRRDDLPGGDKWNMYERYCVPFYWLVDLEARIVLQFEYRDGSFHEAGKLRPDETLASPLFPGITLPVARLFSAPLAD